MTSGGEFRRDGSKSDDEGFPRPLGCRETGRELRARGSGAGRERGATATVAIETQRPPRQHGPQLSPPSARGAGPPARRRQRVPGHAQCQRAAPGRARGRGAAVPREAEASGGPAASVAAPPAGGRVRLPGRQLQAALRPHVHAGVLPRGRGGDGRRRRAAPLPPPRRVRLPLHVPTSHAGRGVRRRLRVREGAAPRLDINHNHLCGLPLI